ncbi:hypothetical protein C772_02959 [Bhargavaea cecembensis DSE10]|uniref:Uncharacterized protein n=1 Tax=Bhargavaea cecembensis DSE10 TaxID=1235279 RepID=M7P3J6_9BACL|nr:hypothetical protein C772_02959 [Bhargavaea cecembensis DSE10]
MGKRKLYSCIMSAGEGQSALCTGTAGGKGE